MKRKYLNIAMYDAMDFMYDEHPSEDLLQFVSDANPYLYKERTAVDPALQKDFDNSMDRQNIGADVDEETAYYAVKNFLSEQYPKFAELAGNKKSPSFADLFEKISLEEWKKLCALIEKEESR